MLNFTSTVENKFVVFSTSHSSDVLTLSNVRNLVNFESGSALIGLDRSHGIRSRSAPDPEAENREGICSQSAPKRGSTPKSHVISLSQSESHMT